MIIILANPDPDLESIEIDTEATYTVEKKFDDGKREVIGVASGALIEWLEAKGYFKLRIRMSDDDKAFLKRVGGRLLGNPPTLECTMTLCRQALADMIPGDFVECGVFAGCHPAVMAREARKTAKTTHLFDSFQGIPHAGPNDDESITGLIGPNKDGALVSSGHSVCSVAQVQQHMKEWGFGPQDRIRYHVGWFQATVPQAAEGELAKSKIAVLRLDGDLYESTMVCLEHLFPLVSRGGYVIIDDYALGGCRKAVDKFREWIKADWKINAIPGGDGPVWFRNL